MINEFEAKFLNINKVQVQNTLSNSGFKIKDPEYLSRRYTFDFPAKSEFKKWARVRKDSKGVSMTIKEIRGERISDVFECEVEIDDFNKGVQFLVNCGLIKKSYQENLRENWVRGNVTVSIDSWPSLNCFIEIESSSKEEVIKVSNELGFDFKNAVFGSIDKVYNLELGIEEVDFLELPEVMFDKKIKN